jgi:hypothetical protein
VHQIDKITRALGRSHPSEENGRWILNSLLLEAYEIATVICPHAAQPLNIQAERGWKYGPVKWHRRKYFLTGRPDYGVWYGEEEAVSLNVVVVEAKREPGGTEQALGYMGKYLSNTGASHYIIHLKADSFNRLHTPSTKGTKEEGLHDLWHSLERV